MESELLQVFLDQAESFLPTIRGGILVSAQTGNIYGELNNSLQQTISIRDLAELVNLDDVSKAAGKLEEMLREFAPLKTALTGEQSRRLLDDLTALEILLAKVRFNTEDFSVDVADFINESFENLGFNQLVAEASEAANEPAEEFEIDAEMLEIFAEEAEELIQSIRANLQNLEKNPNDREALLEIRRNAHTLKGSAGIINLKTLSQVAHRVEDLLDFVAENEIAGNEKIFALLLISTDCFSALANNENSPLLTKKIADLYAGFDALSASLKREKQIKESRPENAAEKTPPPNFPVSAPLASPAKMFPANISGVTNPPAALENSQTNRSMVRISLEKLDDLVKITSGLVVSRSIFEQRLAELEQQIGELHNSTRRLQHSTAKLEADFEADMLNGQNRYSRLPPSRFGAGNSQMSVAHSQNFDTLELDRYTDFHQAMRVLAETTGDTSAINAELDNLKGNLETLFDNQRHLIEEMQEKLLHLRMVSFGSLGVRLQRTVRVTADEEEKAAELFIEGENLEIDTQILDSLVEPLLHLLRNAVAHGIESPETRRLLGKPEMGKINVRVHDEGTHVIMTIADDGSGISAAALKEKAVRNNIITSMEAEMMSNEEAFALIFLAGFTTAETISQTAGRGVGMNIVKAAITRQKGTISIDSEPHKGTTFTIRLPMALAAAHALIVKASERTFAFPLKLVKYISQLSAINSVVSNHLPLTANQGESSANQVIFHLSGLLGLTSDTVQTNENTPLIFLKTPDAPCSLLVDEIVKSEEIIIKPLDSPLQNMSEILGATLLGDGTVVPVLDLLYLLDKQKSATFKLPDFLRTETPLIENPKARNGEYTILIVDDSPSVRHLTSNIIKKAGWKAMVAKDGLEALDILQELRDLPDIILTDVEMPRMDGYDFLASLKRQEHLQAIPVIMITSRAGDKHRQKAIDLDVADYLIKPFEEAILLGKIKELCANC